MRIGCEGNNLCSQSRNLRIVPSYVKITACPPLCCEDRNPFETDERYGFSYFDIPCSIPVLSGVEGSDIPSLRPTAMPETEASRRPQESQENVLDTHENRPPGSYSPTNSLLKGRPRRFPPTVPPTSLHSHRKHAINNAWHRKVTKGRHRHSRVVIIG